MSDTMEPGGRSAADLETDVERRRARVDETIDALRNSLSPGQLMDRMVDYMRQSGGSDFARNLGVAMRDNPVPLLLIGTGIGWLMLAGRKEPGPASTGYGADGYVPGGTKRAPLRETVGNVADKAGELRDAAAEKVSHLRENISEAAESVSRSAHDLSAEARRRRHDMGDALHERSHMVSERASQLGSEMRERWQRMSEGQPLLLGALGLALGAALGAMLPRTRIENRLIGETSDELKQNVADIAEGQYEAVKETIAERAQEAKEEVARSYEETKERLDQEGLSTEPVSDGVKSAAAGVAAAVSGGIDDIGDSLRTSLGKVPPGEEEDKAKKDGQPL
ncbi:DUF3618 domain-containing protein [Acetobacteraceae bacterium H6797]|nr:DUF3618 domain-containing protein [Acetobacteraceae bacterium H6797]